MCRTETVYSTLDAVPEPAGNPVRVSETSEITRVNTKILSLLNKCSNHHHHRRHHVFITSKSLSPLKRKKKKTHVQFISFAPVSLLGNVRELGKKKTRPHYTADNTHIYSADKSRGSSKTLDPKLL